MNSDDFTYHSSNSNLVSCFCTGACIELGYCPSMRGKQTTTQETAHEKAQRLGVKVYEEKPNDWSPQRPNPVIGVCGRCSKEIRLNMNTDMCHQNNCPAGIGPQLC